MPKSIDMGTRNNKSAGFVFGSLDGTSKPPLGPSMLPTLGLTKYKNIDLQVNEQNPYKLHEKTEQMFVLKEREREFRDFNKLEREAMHLS